MTCNIMQIAVVLIFETQVLLSTTPPLDIVILLHDIIIVY